MNRLNIIQFLIDKCNAKKYLEVGVQGGYVFNNIKCDYKVGVDPDQSSKATLFITSDEFFSKNSEVFDIIFIDGLHHADQVLRDIENALNTLSPNGYVICHDMNPEEEIIQKVPQETGIWTGDCWKAWVQLRSKRLDLNMFVLDTDYGCGIIKFGSQELLKVNQDLTWENLVKNRVNWLNLVCPNKINKLS